MFANETDPALTNNSAAVVSTVTNAPVVVLADLSLSARAGPQSGTRGTNLVYFLTVSNAGPATATGVVVSNQILYGIKFISATGGAGGSGHGQWYRAWFKMSAAIATSEPSSGINSQAAK